MADNTIHYGERIKAVPLKAPFPYFGGKRPVAGLIWSRLGNVRNYIEPFCGSAAVLLLRPHEPAIETINDADCMVANFWRATQHDPDAVVDHADGPVNEDDMHARHRYLVLSEDAGAFREKMRTDPCYYEPRIAGWWCWGLCCWIGGGWCSAVGDPRWRTVDGDVVQVHPHLGSSQGVHSNRPHAGGGTGAMRGIHRQIPDLSGNCGASGRGVHGSGMSGRPQIADAYSRGRGVNGNDHAETCAARRAWMLDWFTRLRDRLRTVRVCCGDWSRVCSSHSVTTRIGITGVFLDPPYSAGAGRDMNIYATEDGNVAHDVRDWCLTRGDDPMMRIAMAGYEGEHEDLEAHGWSVHAWTTQGGYGNRGGKNINKGRERLWFSPHCISEQTNAPLFSHVEDE